MGHLKEKYTEEYYTGVDKNGKKLNYGVTSSLDADGNYVLRDQDRIILEKIDFKGKTVLALGCGRGEELAFALENGATAQLSVGVDFSAHAIRLCKKVIKSKKLQMPQLYALDALDFVKEYARKAKNDESMLFDVVIMFDFVEHVPRKELTKILHDLKKISKANVLVAVNTPAYKYDNDVLKDGYDDRNLLNILDLSDNLPETQGMHCNKYSRLSLQDYMRSVAYANITEAHYYTLANTVGDEFLNVSYNERWNSSIARGIPILGKYEDDIVEYPYSDEQDLSLHTFIRGNLSGITILTTPDNVEVAYPEGDTDPDMISSISSQNPISKTILDVGTYIGTSAMLFSRLVGEKGSVICFEPNPANRNRSFINLSHNPSYGQNIRIYDFALGSSCKKQKMLLSTDIEIGYSSTSRLEGSHSTISDADLPDGFEEFEVDVNTLDAFLAESGAKPSIIKLDIEGAEYEFLLGAVSTIRESHPLFYIELHSEYCALMCTQLLVGEGYSISVLHEEEDNRVMIKAEYTGASFAPVRAEKDTLIAVNNANAILKKLVDTTGRLKKQVFINRSLDTEMKKCLADIESLKSENSRLAGDNASLSGAITELKTSKSWVITKPLRKSRSMIDAAKRVIKN